jgi:hypothetical protein
MLNMIFAVKNPKEWHKQNYEQNSKHYPYLTKIIKTSLISFFQNHGAKVHFNKYKNEKEEVILFHCYV